MQLHTQRLILRPWTESDFDSFCELCADPEVMKYFPAPLNRDQSLSLAHNIKSLIDNRGWGAWAVEIPNQCDFIGFVGLHIPKDNLPFSPCVEIAWRLAKPYWNKGYATEAAKAAINFGFSELKLSEIVAFTSVTNKASIKVMEKLGMHNKELDFAHPEIPSNHRLSQHVLYSISNEIFSAGSAPQNP